MLESCTVFYKEGGYCWARAYHNGPADWGARIGWKAIWGGAVVEKPLQEGLAVRVVHCETHSHDLIIGRGTLWAPAVL